MKRKFLIGNEELEFEMTNRTVFNLDETYGNFGIVINGLMDGVNIYSNALKILCASCISKELKVDEVEKKLTPTQVLNELIQFSAQLYFDYMGVKEAEVGEKEENKKKE